MRTVPGKLIQTLAVSAALVLCGNPIADWLGIKYWLPGVRKTSMRIEAYLERGEAADVVFLGSSRMLTAVVPRVFEEEWEAVSGEVIDSYTLAEVGHGIGTSAIVFRDTIVAVGCPRIAVFEMSPTALDSRSAIIARTLEHHTSLADTVAMIPDLRRPEHVNAFAWGLLRGWVNMLLYLYHTPHSASWRDSREKLEWTRGSQYDYPTSVPERPLTILRWTQAKREQQLRNTILGGRPPGAKNISMGGAPERALGEILEVVQRCGCRAVFWYPPVTDDMTALYRPAERDAFAARQAELEKTQGVELCRLEDLRLELSDDDFRDFDHLNYRGAEKLSRALARALLR